MELHEDEYVSIEAESTAVFRDKASKFIALAYPVCSEDEVKLRLDMIRKDYFDANHHCFAYKIGHEHVIFRSNDDGEPAGSAGKPIYGQILSAGLSDVLVVVVRYFGGTKLGIPGLINAYKSATREALGNAVSVKKYIYLTCRLEFDYPSMNHVMRAIKEENVKITSQETGQRCTIFVTVRKGILHRFVNRISALRNVQIITI